MGNQISTEPTPRLVSVKFDAVGRAHTFLLSDLDFEPTLSPGDAVVVQMGDRRAYGAVARPLLPVAELAARRADTPKRVLHRASREDVLRRFRHEQREREAKRMCVLKIRERGLAMKLAKVEQLFDGSKLVFYFTAEGRVDFRELVRELASEFRVRIEMRQIGPRDEAKMIGGYGTCGRPLCCTTLVAVVPADLDQDGQAPEPQSEPVASLRRLWPVEVLFALRAAERERGAAWRLRPRERL